MSNDSPVLRRGTAAYIVASICVLTALIQLVAGLMVLNQAPGSASLSAADSVMRVRILLPLGIGVSMYLAAGVAVYLMRIEALACMGCLLARLLARMVNPPVHLVTMLDLLFLLVLIYFAIQLFEQSSTLRARGRSGWRHPFAMILVGLAGGHLTVLVNNLPAYPMLVSNGSVSPLLALAALIGCGAFYAGVLMMHARPERAKKFFLFAALAMGLSLPAWSYRYGFSTPFWLGVPMALLGFGLARHLRAYLPTAS